MGKKKLGARKRTFGKKPRHEAKCLPCEKWENSPGKLERGFWGGRFGVTDPQNEGEIVRVDNWLGSLLVCGNQPGGLETQKQGRIEFGEKSRGRRNCPGTNGSKKSEIREKKAKGGGGEGSHPPQGKEGGCEHPEKRSHDE